MDVNDVENWIELIEKEKAEFIESLRLKDKEISKKNDEIYLLKTEIRELKKQLQRSHKRKMMLKKNIEEMNHEPT